MANSYLPCPILICVPLILYHVNQPSYLGNFLLVISTSLEQRYKLPPFIFLYLVITSLYFPIFSNNNLQIMPTPLTPTLHAKQENTIMFV